MPKVMASLRSTDYIKLLEFLNFRSLFTLDHFKLGTINTQLLFT